jgi:hypothetical protein
MKDGSLGILMGLASAIVDLHIDGQQSGNSC